ncbi:MAG: DUF3343 domain-containing protein [Clostridia bacterium]|nr:DUF3343 domain-containing protein [Clostridia bacterium]
MQRHIISVNSITYAIKGRDLLRKQGFRAYIERKTNANGNAGCGYVIIANGNKNKIINALLEAGINIVDVNTVV